VVKITNKNDSALYVQIPTQKDMKHEKKQNKTRQHGPSEPP
jgi:hypothetical protein